MFLMAQNISAVGMRACRHCHTPVLENHRDNKVQDDKIRHVLIAIYCSGTSSLAQLSKNLGHLQRLAGPPCVADGNRQIQAVILGKLTDTKRWLIDQNEVNKQHFVFIRW